MVQLPAMFNSAEEFDSWFGNKLACAGVAAAAADGDAAATPAASSLLHTEQVLVITNRLHQVLRPFLLRRTKDVLEAELPSKAEHAIACPTSSYQDAMLRLLRDKGKEAQAGAAGGVQGINNVVMEMRKARCVSPSHVPNACATLHDHGCVGSDARYTLETWIQIDAQAGWLCRSATTR
jgi:SNF2 family DNA or RNA helicase